MFFPQISGSKSLEALSEIDELGLPVPKKDHTSGISPESIRRRTTIGGKLHHRSSSPAGMLRSVTSPVQPPHDKYYALDVSIRDFHAELLDVEVLKERTSDMYLIRLNKGPGLRENPINQMLS